MREAEEGVEDLELLELWKEMTRLLQDTVDDQDNETQQHVSQFHLSQILLFENFQVFFCFLYNLVSPHTFVQSLQCVSLCSTADISI